MIRWFILFVSASSFPQQQTREVRRFLGLIRSRNALNALDQIAAAMQCVLPALNESRTVTIA